MYRVVPKRRFLSRQTTSVLCPASSPVQNLVAGDFEPLIDRAQKGDFLFCDPPYTVRHNDNGFVKYNEVLFSWADQERLAAALLRAARRGVKIICTNANHYPSEIYIADRHFR